MPKPGASMAAPWWKCLVQWPWHQGELRSRFWGWGMGSHHHITAAGHNVSKWFWSILSVRRCRGGGSCPDSRYFQSKLQDLQGKLPATPYVGWEWLGKTMISCFCFPLNQSIEDYWGFVCNCLRFLASRNFRVSTASRRHAVQMARSQPWNAWRIHCAGNPERTWSACVATSQWRRPTVFF